MNWTNPDDISAKVRRRWDDGSLLAALAQGEPFPVIEVGLRGPSVSELGDNLEAARAWVEQMDNGRSDDRRYELVWGSIGGRFFGHNRIPLRAVVSRYDQAWALLRVGAAVRRFSEILDLVRHQDAAAVLAWVVAHPHKALDLGDDWPAVLAAYHWLDQNRASGHYLREISAPGVDSKFAERHRATLAALLKVSSSAAGFIADLGLAAKPELIRLRASPGLGLVEPLTEVALRVDEVSRLSLRPRAVLIVENEITYLSVPLPPGGMVIWGRGFAVDLVGRFPWLDGVPVDYWGDLDSHGFAILNRLRAWLPQVRSLLMDRDTLLAHRDRWVGEDRPATLELSHLTAAEQELYADLVTDRYGVRLRLEQERIDWAWARARLTTGGEPTREAESRTME